MRLFPQPDVEDSRPQKGPVMTTSTMAPNPKFLQIRMFGLLAGLQVRDYVSVPFTQGAAGSNGFGSERA